MNLTEVHDLLRLVASVDNRRFDDTTVAAWHAILGDLPMSDAQYAVVEHFKTGREYLMPVHIRTIALAIARERRRIERETETAEREALEAACAVPVQDRSAEVGDLLQALADRLGPSDPTVLRRAEWVDREQRRLRQLRADATPNPLFKGFPPPSGFPLPEGETA